MPEDLTEPKQVTVADNLCIRIDTRVSRIYCTWDLGYMDQGTFVHMFADAHVFEGAAYAAIAESKDFLPNQTNYENIRRVLYAALKDAGVI